MSAPRHPTSVLLTPAQRARLRRRRPLDALPAPALTPASPPVRHDPRREDVEGREVDPTVGEWVR